MVKISANIITLNEEDNIARCIESIKDLVDEIIIVDSGSTDKTVEITKKYTSKVYFRKFDNYSNQKNYALKKSTGDWILLVDADEEIPKDLVQEIQKAVLDSAYAGYLIPRKNILLGGFINHTRWSPDKHIWLWKRNSGKWIGEIHEEVQVDGEVGELENPKIHYSYATIYEFFDMTNNYTTKIAEQEYRNGIKYSLFRLIVAFPRSFIGRFILKQGYLDGWRGFILSYMMGIYRLASVIKLWEKSQKESQVRQI